MKTRDHMLARGPDDSGSWWDPDGRFALGHRRLSIIDLDRRAAQPMASRCRRYTVAFNGEIYNYLELRGELAASGVEFRTTSDTEVLLELFARDGVDCFSRLIGMFAVAIWDTIDKVLWIARDSFGIKPLYYADDGWSARVGSQVKALIAGGGIKRTPEPAGIVGFLVWGAVPEPFTLFQDIRSVPPGHSIRIGTCGPENPRAFLSLECIYNTSNSASASELTIRDAVTASVKRHLVADVPVGLFLSSGIDSAALLAAIYKIDPQQAAETTAVTLGFDEYANSIKDESRLAAVVANNFGSKHVTRFVTKTEFQSDLPKILAAMDQPSIDGINTWFVSKAAVEVGLKVALSGVGGDELFAGYPSFQQLPRWKRILSIPASIPLLGRSWASIVSKLYPGVRSNPKIAGLLAYGASWEGLYLLRRGLFLPLELNELLDPDLARVGLERLTAVNPLSQLLKGAPRANIPRVSLMESGFYMRNQLLRDADWASMAHSLEIRTPLVDTELLRAIRPMQARISGKEILARAFNLPEEVSERPKTGFSTPIGEWITGEAFHGGDREPYSRVWARHIFQSDCFFEHVT